MIDSSDFKVVSQNTILFSLKKAFQYKSKNKLVNKKKIFLKGYDGNWENIVKDPKLLIWASVVLQRCKLHLNCDDLFETIIDYLDLYLKERPDTSFLKTLKFKNITNSNILILNNHPYLKEILGNELSGSLIEDPSPEKLINTLTILSDLGCASNVENLINEIYYLALAKNKYGTINSLTCPNFPGFAIISIDNPPVLILEQLIHESTHLNFDLNMITNEDFSDFTKMIPAVFSPIVDKPRPFEKFATGFFAYLNVFYFWNNISNIKSREIKFKLFETNNLQKITDIIHARLEKLRTIINESFCLIERIMLNDKLDKWNMIFRSMKILDSSIVQFKTKNKKTIKSIENTITNNIELAELLLGINGEKVSRVCRSVLESKTINEWAYSNEGVCYFSSFYIVSKPDKVLEGFSNIEAQRISLDQDVENEDLYFYVGKNSSEVMDCVHKDEIGKAGNHFQIPKCCRTFFDKNWENALKNHNGDLASFLMGKQIFTKKIEPFFMKECNVFAMYFDNGPLWHFPCSFNCKATMKMISRRLESLYKINNKLHNIFSDGIKYPILWSENFGVGQLFNFSENSISLNWLGNKINKKEISKIISQSLSKGSKQFSFENNIFNLIIWD